MGKNNYKTRFHQCFRSKLIENLFSFFEYCDIKTMKPKYAKKLTNISGGIFSLFNILLDLFIGLCPIIQQKRRSPDAATYSRRITNNTFFRPVKIIMCIWRVGNKIFPFGIQIIADYWCRWLQTAGVFQKKIVQSWSWLILIFYFWNMK